MKVVKEYKIVLVLGLFMFLAVYFIRDHHEESVEGTTNHIVNLHLENDSLVNIITKDSMSFQLRITGKDSLYRLYYNKTQYLELLLNKKNKQLVNTTKDDKKLKLDILNLEKENDSLVGYINSLERVSVPD